MPIKICGKNPSKTSVGVREPQKQNKGPVSPLFFSLHFSLPSPRRSGKKKRVSSRLNPCLLPQDFWFTKREMGSSPPPPPYGVGLAALLPPKEEKKAEKKVDYLNLPCPVPFEEIQREALSESTFCFVSICFFYLDPSFFVCYIVDIVVYLFCFSYFFDWTLQCHWSLSCLKGCGLTSQRV